MKMIKLPTLARSAVGVAVAAIGICVAAACSDRGALTPNTPATSRMSAASATKPFQMVLLRPVMTQDRLGTTRTTYATKVVYLRPVMLGEALPKSD
jgi:hypothetical protein